MRLSEGEQDSLLRETQICRLNKKLLIDKISVNRTGDNDTQIDVTFSIRKIFLVYYITLDLRRYRNCALVLHQILRRARQLQDLQQRIGYETIIPNVSRTG